VGAFTVTVTDDVPLVNANAAPVLGAVDEGGLTAATDGYGTGNDPAFAASASGLSGSLNNLVKFGADGPAGTAFQFVDPTTAGAWVASLGLNSHGFAVNAVSISGSILTALDSHGDSVFTLTLNGDGSWTFKLLEPLDHPASSTPENTVTFDLSGLVQGVDFDGDVVTLASGAFKITVTDDVPVISGTVSGSVDEGGLTAATDPYGTGNDAGFATVASGSLGVHFGADGPAAATIVTNNQTIDFSGLTSGNGWSFGNIHVGTDQGLANPGGNVQVFGKTVTVTDNAGLFVFEKVDLALFGTAGSGGDKVVLTAYDAQNNVIATETVDVGTPVGLGTAPGFHFNATGSPFDGLEMAKLTISPISGTGNVGFSGSVIVDNLVVATQTVTNPPISFTDQTTAANNVSVTDNGQPVTTLTSHGQTVHYALLDADTLVGYTGSTAPTSITASNVVFSVVLSAASANGSYTFTLDQPLDQKIAGEDNLAFTFKFTAKDFDGDTQSGTFAVTDTDDVPVLVAQTPVAIVDGSFQGNVAGGSGDFPNPGGWGGPIGAFDTKGFIDNGAWTYSASPVGGASNVQLERVGSGYAGATSSNGAPMVDLEASPGNIEISQTLHNLAAGEKVEINFEMGEANFGNAKLAVLWDGQQIATYDPQSGPTQLESLVVTATGNNDTITFEEIGQSGDNTGTYLTNVSAQQVAGVVDEGGLNVPATNLPVGPFGSLVHFPSIVGNDQGAATVATGTLAGLVSFGADGPATGGGFQLVAQSSADATSEIAGLHLSSLGSAVTQATLVGNTIAAFAADGHEVFTLTVNGNGGWTFTLLAPLDDAHNGEDAITLDLSSFVKAVDFDGDPVTLSGDFKIAVIDDVPVVTGAADVGHVDEHGLKSDANPTGGTQVAEGSLNVAWGADDGAAKHFAFALDGQGNPIGAVDAGGNALHLTSGGQALAYEIIQTLNGPDLIAYYQGSDPTNLANQVFGLTLSAPPGENTPFYTFALFHPLDESGPGADTLTINFHVTGFDSDGDSVPQTVTIDVKDDVPTVTGNLLVNGSFEQGHTDIGDGQWSIYTAIPGWTSGPDGVPFEVQVGNIGGVTAEDGSTKVELDSDKGGGNDSNNTNPTGHTNATIEQTVDTVTGQTYELTFWYSPRAEVVPSASSSMNVLWNGQVVGNIDSTDLVVGWNKVALDLTATGTSSIVGFQGTGAEDSFGALIDNVSLTAVGLVHEDAANPSVTNAPIGVLWGADGSGSLTFADQVHAGNDVTVTGSGPMAGLTSGGEAVSYAFIGAVLVGYVGSAPAAVTDGNVVFTLSIADTGSGAYTFDLKQPLDHPAPDVAGDHYIDLTFATLAADGDGDTVSAPFTVRVDAAGVITGSAHDTIDYSADAGGVFVNLSESSQTVDGQTVAADTATDLAGTAHALLGIDQLGTDIRNAVGTGGDDIFVGGSEADNLSGGGGNDTFVYNVSSHGQETIDGGDGTDTALIVNDTGAAQTFNVNPILLNGVSEIGVHVEAGAGIDVQATTGNYQVATTNVEELVIQLGNAGDTVAVNGDLSGTGLATSTITITGGAGDDTVDLSGFLAKEDVVFDGGGNGAHGDTVLFGYAFDAATYAPIYDSTGTTLIGVTVTSGGVTDTFTNVENFQFSDGTRTLGELFPPTANPVTEAVSDTGHQDAGHVLATGNAITDVNDSDVLTGTALSIAAAGSASQPATTVGTDTVIQGAYGELTISADGSYSYTANAALDALQIGQNPTDTFTLTVADSDGGTSGTTLNFNITGVNDAPFTSNDTVATSETGAYTFQVKDFPFTDVDGSLPQNVIITSLPTSGTLTDGGNAVVAGEAISFADITAGKLVFTPGTGAGFAATSTFGFEVQDNGGTANGGADTSAAATMTIDVSRVGPTTLSFVNATGTGSAFADTTSSMLANGDKIGSFVAGGDPNPGDTFTYSFQSGTTTGLSLNGSTGALTVNSTSFKSLTDTFTVAATDAQNDPPATLTVTVWVGGSGADSAQFAGSTSDVLLAYGLGGNDTITGESAANSTNILVGAAGNDTFNLTSASFTSHDIISGGAGTDAIQLTDTTGVTVVDSAFTNVTGVEKLVIGGSGTNTVTLGTAASADAASATGATLTVDDSAGTGNLTVNGSAMTANLTVIAGTGTTDNLTGGSGNDTFQFAVANFDPQTVAGGAGTNKILVTDPTNAGITIVDSDFANVSGIQTLAVNGGNFNDVTLGADASAEIGSGTLTVDGTAATAVVSIDVTAMTANFALLGSNGPAVTNNFFITSEQFANSPTIKGGSFNAPAFSDINIADAANIADTAFKNVSNVGFLFLGDFTNSVTVGTNAAHSGLNEIDGSAATAGHNLTVDASGLGANANFTIFGGAGDDLFKLASNDFTSNMDIDGGGGANAIQITNAATIGSSAFSRIFNVEKLILGDFTNSVTLPKGISLTIDDTAAVTSSHALTVDASALDSTSTLDVLGGAGNDIVKVTGVGGFATSHGFGVNLSYNGEGGSDTLQVVNTGSSFNIVDTDFANISSVETLAMGETATTITNNITLGADVSADVGTGGTFTVDDHTGKENVNIDGSAMVANLAVLLGSGTDTVIAGGGTNTFTGGSGADTFTYNVATGGTETANGGAGTDTQIINGTSSPTTYNIDPITIGGTGYIGVNIESGTGAGSVVPATAGGYTVATTAVEELHINLGSAGDHVVVGGDLSGTGLATTTITITGGAGDDTVDLSGFVAKEDVVFDGGGNGTNGDTVIFGYAFGAATYAPIYGAGNALVGVTVTQGGVADTFTNVEHFQFSDGTRTLGQLFPPSANPVTVTVNDTANPDAGHVLATGNAITDVHDSDVLIGTALSITSAGSALQTSTTVGTDTVIHGTYGDLTISADGSYSYTANAALDALQVGQNPADVFSLTVADSDGGTSTTTLTVNVVGANDAAVISGDTTGAVTEAGGVNNGTPGIPTVTGTLHDADVDSPQTFVAESNVATAYGTFSLAATGAWSYTLDNTNPTVQGLNVGGTLHDTFQVTTADGTSQTLDITINGADDAPVNAVPGAQTVLNIATLVLSAANHDAITVSDVDNTTLTETLSVLHGTLTLGGTGVTGLSGNGTATVTFSGTQAQIDTALDGLTYTPTSTYTGADTLKIVTNDGTLSTTDTVAITVNPGDHAPVIQSSTDGTITWGQAPIIGPELVVNGSFEQGAAVVGGTFENDDPTGWTFNTIGLNGANVPHTGIWDLQVTTFNTGLSGDASAYQNIPTVAGQHYTLDFWLETYNGNTPNDFNVLWNGAPVVALQNLGQQGYTEYAVDVVGGPGATSQLTFAGHNDEGFFQVDDVSVKAVSDVTSGTVTFTDADLTDAHTVTATADNSGYVGLFTAAIGPGNDSTGGVTGTVNWTFSVDPSVVNALAPQQSIVQTYTVTVDDGHGGTASRDVSVTLTNPDHAPVITGETDGSVTAGFSSTIPVGNLLQNPSFEQYINENPVFLPAVWTIGGNTGGVQDVNPGHTGAASAQFYNTGGTTLSETVSTIVGETYTVDFFVTNTWTASNGLTVSENGNTLGTIVNLPASNYPNYVWSEFNYSFVATSSSTTLTFNGSDSAPFGLGLDLDDVTLQVAGVTHGIETASGTISFTDADATDTHAISFVPDHNGYIGTFTPTLATDSTGGHTGVIDWNFSVSDADIYGAVAAQQTVTQTYTVTIDDGHGGKTTQDVAVSITNPDHAPVVTHADNGTFTEYGAEQTSNLIVNGGFETGNIGPWAWSPYSEIVLGNPPNNADPFAHGGVGDAYVAATYTSGSTSIVETLGQTFGTIPGLEYKVDFWLTNDSGTGPNSVTLTWNGNTIASLTNVPGTDAGQGVTYSEYTYDVVATSMTSALQFAFKNDVSSFYLDDVSVTAVSGQEATQGVVNFTDADTTDTHTVTFTPDAAGYIGTFAANMVTDATGGHTGAIDWTFGVADSDIGTLAKGQTLTQSYTVTIDDGHGGKTTDDVVVTIVGADHAPTPVADEIAVNVNQTASAATRAAGVLGNDTDPDAGDAATLTVSAILAGTSGTPILLTGGQASVNGTYGTLTIHSDGTYSYTPNDAAAQALGGKTAADVFTYTAMDSSGETGTTTLTFDVTGQNAAPVITSGAQTGSVTEDASLGIPNLVLNGDFDFYNGQFYTLNAWNVSGSNITVAGGDNSGGAAYFYGSQTTISQTIATVPGTLYYVDFWVDNFGGSLNVLAGGNQIGSVASSFTSNWVEYDYQFVATGSSTTISFAGQGGIEVDTISVTSGGRPGVETTSGTIAFTDANAGDTHVVSVTPNGTGYYGLLTASVGTDTTGGHPGSVNWSYNVSDASIQGLTGGQTVTQTYTVTIADGYGGTTTQNVTITLHGVNEAPTLSPSDTLALNNEAATHVSGTNFGVVGTLVSALVGNGSGANNVTDPDSGAKLGIAITGVSNTLNGTGGGGVWYYSTNNGTSWIAFPSVSGTNALLLAADANTRIFFEPNSSSKTGTATITFDAWDQTSGSNGGTADTTVNGGSSAFSNSSESASLFVGTATSGAATLTNGADTVFYLTGTSAVTGTSSTLGTNDSIVGDGSNTLNLSVSGTSGTYTFDFTAMKAFADMNVALTGTISKNVSFILGNQNVADGQTITVNGAAMGSGHTFTVDASQVNDGGNINIIAAHNANNVLTGGASSVTFEFLAANFTSNDQVFGEGGNDTLWITDATAFTVNDSAFTNVGSVATIKVGGSGTDTLNLGAAASADVFGAGHTLTIDDTTGTGALVINQANTGTTANLLVEMHNAQFTASDTIHGGAGSDTIQLVDTAGVTVTDAAFTHVTSIETLQIGGTGANSVTLDVHASADVGDAAGTLTIDDTNGTGPLTVTATNQFLAKLLVVLDDAELAAAPHITGGANGGDTIEVVDTTGVVVTDAAFANVHSIETLAVGGLANDSLTLGANASADVGGIGHTFTLDLTASSGSATVDGSLMTASLNVLLDAAGGDALTGGSGDDTYQFNAMPAHGDVFTNFNNTTQHDSFAISAAGFGGGLTAGLDASSVFESSNSSTFASSANRFHFDTANGGLYYSADGTTAHEVLLATVTNGATIHANDIHVVA
jgi:T1SS-143 domain-containing protein